MLGAARHQCHHTHLLWSKKPDWVIFVRFVVRCYKFCSSAQQLALYSVSRQPPALAELTVLYVRRTCSLWKEAAVMLWLEESVKEVLRRVDASDPLVEDCQNKWEALSYSVAACISSAYSRYCVPGGSSGTRVLRGTSTVTFFCQKSKRPFQVCL